MVPMLIGMSDRASNSAGLAVFAEPLADKHHKYSLYFGSAFNWQGLTQAYQTHFGIEPNPTAPIGDRAVLISELSPYPVKLWLKQNYPHLHILSTGCTILLKVIELRLQNYTSSSSQSDFNKSPIITLLTSCFGNGVIIPKIS